MQYKKIPDFCLKENIKDKNGNTPNDPSYDSSTLYIPEE